MRPLYLSLIWASLLFNSAFAQPADYESGYIVKGGDTIPGEIKRSDEISLSKVVYFKPPAGQEKEYLPADIDGFGFSEDKILFQPVEVQLKQKTDSPKILRFAKVMVKGTADLFKIQLSLKDLAQIYELDNTFVYVVKKGGQFYTLAQYESITNQRYKLDKKYVGVLTFLFSDCQQLQQFNFNNLKFNDKDIISLTERYNNCKDPASTVVLKHVVKPIVKSGPEAYIGIAAQDQNEVSSYLLGIGYFWEILRPDISRKFALKTGLTYQHVSARTSDQGRNSSHYVNLPFVLKYHFHGPNKLNQPFLIGGLNPGFSVGDNINYQLAFDVYLNLGAGLNMNRLRLALVGQSPLGGGNGIFLNLNLGLALNKNRK